MTRPPAAPTRDPQGVPLAAAEPKGHARVVAIDLARGVALLAMFVYHLAFDLRLFGFVDWDVAGDPLWRGFAISIASTFLFLSGASLVLAHGEGIRWHAFRRRFAIVAGSAALVTAATLVAMPLAPVWFGILHAVALFGLLGLAFLRLPVPAVVGTAGIVLALPFLWRSSVFDGLGFVWLGLAEDVPPMVDHEPLFPWFAATLLGIAAARVALARSRPAEWVGPPRGRAGRTLAFMGRNSLPIYLVHQPVFFAILMPIAWVAGGGAPEDPLLSSFRSECTRVCEAGNPAEGYCDLVCGCVVDGVAAAGLVEPIRAAGGASTPEIDAAVGEITRGCVAAHGGVLEDPAEPAWAAPGG